MSDLTKREDLSWKTKTKENFLQKGRKENNKGKTRINLMMTLKAVLLASPNQCLAFLNQQAKKRLLKGP